MVAVIRGLHGKLLERRELTLNAVEPRAVGWCQVDTDVVALGPRQHLGGDVRAIVVHHHVQDLLLGVT